MLPLFISVLATAYFVVPDLLSRFVLGIFLVKKTMNSPKGEELMRGALWALLPLILAWFSRHWFFWRMPDGFLGNVRIVFSSLYSEKSFDQQSSVFFGAAKAVVSMNLCLLSRTYFFVTLGSAALGLMARDFGRLRSSVSNHPNMSKFLHFLVLPRISEWHFALSPMLLKDPKQYSVSVDVMTKSGLLYRGSVNEKAIASDGKLETLILTGVDRFLYPEFVRARAAYEASNDKPSAVKPVRDTYWRRIPGELFLITGSEISTVNVRHVSTVSSSKPAEDAELSEILVKLNEKLQARLKG